VPHPCGFQGAGFDLLGVQRVSAIHSARFTTDERCHLCSQIVNTSSQIGTVQSSHPALPCLVKSPLATLPEPATPANSFPFYTDTLSTFKFQRPIREFRFSLFAFRVSCFDFRGSSLSPLSTAFTPNLPLSPLSTAFTQINRGVGSFPRLSTFNCRLSTSTHPKERK